MALLTIRNVPDDMHRALRVRAARHGRSTEAEVREILAAAVKLEKRVRMGESMAALAAKSGWPTKILLPSRVGATRRQPAFELRLNDHPGWKPESDAAVRAWRSARAVATSPSMIAAVTSCNPRGVAPRSAARHLRRRSRIWDGSVTSYIYNPRATKVVKVKVKDNPSA